MKRNSVFKFKHFVWAVCPIFAAILLLTVDRSGAKSKVQASSPPVVEIAFVEQRNVPICGEWIGTLAGQVTGVAQASDTGSGAVEARVGVRGSAGWRPGMTGEARVTLRESNLWGSLWWGIRKRVRTDLLL